MYVNVIDLNNVFHPEQRTRNVLQDLNLRTHQLVCVTKPPDDWKLPAICKVMTNEQVREMEQREKQLAKEAKKKDPHSVVKQLELNWAIDANDLGHRMKKMREFLGRGYRLEVIVSPKRRGRKADVEEAQAVLDKLREVVMDEEGQKLGWKEWKAMDGELAAVATLYFEGKVSKAAAAEMEASLSESAPEEEVKREKEVEKQTESEKGKVKALTDKQLAKRDKWKNKK